MKQLTAGFLTPPRFPLVEPPLVAPVFVVVSFVTFPFAVPPLVEPPLVDFPLPLLAGVFLAAGGGIVLPPLLP